MFYIGKIHDEAIATLEHFAVLLNDLAGDMDNIEEVHQQSRISSQSGACQWNIYHQLYYHALLLWQAFNAIPALPSPGDWVGQIHQNGNHCGLPFLRPAFPLESCYVVDAKRLQRPLQM